MRKVRQQKLHALSPMATVIGIRVDMDHDEACDWEAGYHLNELAATFVAAAMPVQLGLTNAQTLQRLAHSRDIIVIA